MSRRRRIRDKIYGDIYYNIDERDFTGAGVISEALKNVASSITSKLTGKAAKRIAEKAAEKAFEKGAEKVGEKTGQLLGEKIYDRFTRASAQAPLEKNKGDQIIKEMKRKAKHRKTEDLTPKDQRQEDRRSLSISQQFDELLQKM